MLVDFYRHKFTLLIQTQTTNDEGGTETVWSDGMTFDGAMVRNTTSHILQSDSENLYNSYTLTVSRSISLNFHDVVRDEATQKTYSILSDETQTPLKFTSLDMRQYNAERWDIE